MTLALGDALRWEDDAACRRHDPELWHNRDTAGTALHICWTHCPVRTQCNTWAHHTGGWAEQVIGGHYWVHAQGNNRPTVQTIDHTSSLCRTCRGPNACGTLEAWRRHRDRGEDPCNPCRAAYRAWDKERGRARRAAHRMGVSHHSTPAGTVTVVQGRSDTDE